MVAFFPPPHPPPPPPPPISLYFSCHREDRPYVCSVFKGCHLFLCPACGYWETCSSVSSTQSLTWATSVLALPVQSSNTDTVTIATCMYTLVVSALNGWSFSLS